MPIDKKTGLLKVEDSIRKMKLQDAKGKISPHEVCLRVDDASVKIVDSVSFVSFTLFVQCIEYKNLSYEYLNLNVTHEYNKA